ncbi:unnamed protein product [Absidia cylindrospora]
MPVRQIISSPHFAFITPEKFFHAIPSLAFWGAGTAAALSLFGSDVPLVKKDICPIFRLLAVSGMSNCQPKKIEMNSIKEGNLNGSRIFISGFSL